MDTTAAWTAIGIFAGYVVVIVTLWKVLGVRYDALADSRRTVIRGIIVPIGIGAVLLAVATTLLGWWSPVLTQTPRTPQTWTLVVPVLLAVTAFITCTGIDFTSPNKKVLPAIAIGVVLVGFAEEVLTRGLLIVGPTKAGWSPLAAFLVSALLFSLLHSINALFGQSVQVTIVQMVMSLLAAAAFYVTRMSTGLLVVCIALHALWDFATLGVTATNGAQPKVAQLSLLVTLLAGVVAAGFVIAST